MKENCYQSDLQRQDITNLERKNTQRLNDEKFELNLDVKSKTKESLDVNLKIRVKKSKQERKTSLFKLCFRSLELGLGLYNLIRKLKK